jgi:hypothetical protein
MQQVICNYIAHDLFIVSEKDPLPGRLLPAGRLGTAADYRQFRCYS